MSGKIIFSDYPDKTGKIKEIVCKGHVNFELFMSEAKKKYRIAPFKVRHHYRVFRRIGTTKINGRKTGGFNTYVYCDERTPRSEPITIGYY
jgi:hypothetical protein